MALPYWTRRRNILKKVKEHMKYVKNGESTSLALDSCQRKASSDLQNIGEIDSIPTESGHINCSSNNSANMANYRFPLQSSHSLADDEQSAVNSEDLASTSSFSAIISELEKEEEECRVESDSDSDFDCDENELSEKLHDDLCSWVYKNKIAMTALKELLCILRQFHPSLPKDPRTLLKTPQNCIVKSVGSGSYYHFGIWSTLTDVVAGLDLNLSSCHVQLQINVDGLPLFKSSGTQFWPILGRVSAPFITDPFVIGLYCGKEKPNNVNEYLFDFVKEMRTLQEGSHYLPGVVEKVTVALSCVICDTPARAFVKQVKGHTGYYGCDKCTQKGMWEGKMTFPEVNSPLRTDVQFDEMAQSSHHTGESPFKELSVGMVSQLPLDYMHLVCLGVTRRLLWYWIRSPISKGFRLGQQSISEMCRLLVVFKEYLPREFSRKCRPFAELDRWKATEYRQFLLYSGIVVLKGNISHTLYHHFLLYFVAIKCLCSPEYCFTNADYANELLCMFVSQASDIYGRDFLVYNVHGLVHIAQDVKLFGPLDAFSAFPFENFLSSLKRLVSNPRYPLHQVIKRLSERKTSYFLENSKTQLPNKIPMKKNCGPLPLDFCDAEQFKQIQSDNLFFSISNGDNCIQAKGSVCLIRNIIVPLNSKETLLVVERFSSHTNFFTYPLDSSKLNIFKVSDLVGVLETVTLSDVQKKMILFPFKTDFVAIPL